MEVMEGKNLQDLFFPVEDKNQGWVVADKFGTMKLKE